MEPVQQQINLFHILFYVCLGVCIFCLIFSMILFFQFDIIRMFHARTGQLRRPVGREGIIQPPTCTEALDAGATEVLDRSIQTSAKGRIQGEADESHGMFRIEKYELYIHTNEIE